MTGNASCVFVGRLTRDIELKSLSSGANVANGSMAINDSYVDKSGEKKERTTFVDLEFWGYTAQNAATLQKGQMVIVVATPRMFQKEEGAKSQIAFRVEEIGVVPRANKGDVAPKTTKAPVKKTVTKTVEVEVEDDSNETPF